MTDSQSVKAIDLATITGSVLPGSALAFERIASSDPKVSLRSNSSVGSLSPTTIRIQHTAPAKGSNGSRRAIYATDQTLMRLDSQSNPIGAIKGSIASSALIPETMTLTEFRAMAALHYGDMLANNGAKIDAIYRGEV